MRRVCPDCGATPPEHEGTCRRTSAAWLAREVYVNWLLDFLDYMEGRGVTATEAEGELRLSIESYLDTIL